MRWVAVGLEDPYTGRFKNVAIADNEDLEQASFVIWDRVYRKSEASDVARIKKILLSQSMDLDSLNFYHEDLEKKVDVLTTDKNSLQRELIDTQAALSALHAEVDRLNIALKGIRNKTIDFCLSLLNDCDQSCDPNRILLYIEGELEKAKNEKTANI